jgi:hypothetical protein
MGLKNIISGQGNTYNLRPSEDSSDRRKRYIKQTAIFRLEGLNPLKYRSSSIMHQPRPIFRVVKTPRSRSF